MPEAVQGALSQTGFDDIRSFDMLAGILTDLDSRSDYNMFFVSRFEEPPGSLTGAFSPTDVTGTHLERVHCPCSSSGTRYKDVLGTRRHPEEREVMSPRTG
jgi:hypothetical protein